MTLSDSPDEYFTKSKSLIREAAQKDGKLFSPIDLSLNISKPLYLDKLEWVNLGDAPSIMKMTNAGDTVIISAQWPDTRPYLAGGPLDDCYVFSQIHFHWGAGDHEGSEHSVEGSYYPLEMHTVFYKSQYCTQDAALRKDDGIVVIVHLCKLRDKSSPGIEWLSPYLDEVVEPQMSTILSLSPLSSLLVPFTLDYILYWGSLIVGHCSHVMLWLVSRAALGISLEDLNKFRRLLCSRKEAMNKNFLAVSSTQDRTIFHVNPSTETKHFLLPGIIESRKQLLDFNQSIYTQMTVLNQQRAEQIFSRRYSEEEELISMTEKIIQSTKLEEGKSSSITHDSCDGSNLENIRKTQKNKTTNKLNLSPLSSDKTCATSPTMISVNKSNLIKKASENTKVNEIKSSSIKDDLCKETHLETAKEQQKKIIARNKYRLNSFSSNKPCDTSPTRISRDKTNVIVKTNQSIKAKEIKSSLAKDNLCKASHLENLKEPQKNISSRNDSNLSSEKASDTSPTRVSVNKTNVFEKANKSTMISGIKLSSIKGDLRKGSHNENIKEPQKKILRCKPNLSMLSSDNTNDTSPTRIVANKTNVIEKANQSIKNMKSKPAKEDFCKESNLENIVESQKNISRNNSNLTFLSSDESIDSVSIRISVNKANVIETNNQSTEVKEIKSSSIKNDFCKGFDQEDSKETQKKISRNKSDLSLLSSVITNNTGPTRIPMTKTSRELHLEKLNSNKFKTTCKIMPSKPQVKKDIEVKRVSSESLVTKKVHEPCLHIKQTKNPASLINGSTTETLSFKSKLPVRTINDKSVLKSSLFQYFGKPGSAPQSEKSQTESAKSPGTEKYQTKLKYSLPESIPEKIKKPAQSYLLKPLGLINKVDAF